MSVPFAGAPADNKVRIIQLRPNTTGSRGTGGWLSETKALSTLTIPLSPSYSFFVDIHDYREEYVYTLGEKKITVRSGGSIIGVISGHDIDSKVKPMSLRGVDVLFHLGDTLWIEKLLWTKSFTTDLIAEKCIQTWNSLPMSEMSHRYIPDDSDMGSLKIFNRKNINFATVTKCIDIIFGVINGNPREEDSYYAVKYVTPLGDTYIAVSNWYPDSTGRPTYVSNMDIVTSLIDQGTSVLEDTVGTSSITLMVSGTALSIINTIPLNIISKHNMYKNTLSSYSAFAKLKKTWNVDLTVISGDFASPAALSITCDGVTYPLYCTGSYTHVYEEHKDKDIYIPPHLGICRKIIPGHYHLQTGHSYIRMLRNRVYTMFQDVDPFHSVNVLVQYFINGMV